MKSKTIPHQLNTFKLWNLSRGFEAHLLFVCSLLFTLTDPATGRAASYYVSPAGSDGNNGTTTNTAWKTLQYAVLQLSAGDTLYVRGGIYAERVWVGCVGTATSPITITAYPGESPIIDGGSLPGADWRKLLDVSGSNLKISGFEVRNSSIAGTNFGGYGIYVGGASNTVSKMNVHHCWENGILASGDYSTVEDSVVWQNCLQNSAPPHLAWSSGLSAARDPVNGITDHAILRRNVVFNNWGEGLSTYEADGTIIEENIVYDNWAVNVYISDARNVLAQRNLIYTSTNSILIPRNGDTIALSDEQPSKPPSANNTVINNFVYGGAFTAFSWTVAANRGLDNVLIANNTLVNAQFGIGAYPGSGITNKSAIIINNIFLADTGDPWAINSDLSNLSFSHNLWFKTPPAGISGGVTDIIGDPQLTRTGSTSAGLLSSNYFKLLSHSPAINSAAILGAVTNDYFGIARGAAPDIGGYEFQPCITGGQFCDARCSRLTGLSFAFSSGTAGQPYRIQTSTNLAAGSWTDLTNFNYIEPIVIVDPSAATGTKRFYRAVTP